MKFPFQFTKLLAALMLMLLPLCGGCWNQVEVGTAAIVTGMGLDLDKKDQIKFTAQVITPQSTGGGESSGGNSAKKPFLAFSATDNTVSKAARDLSLYVPRTLLWAHASAYVLGEDMAKKGVPLIVDFLDRNRNIRKSGFLYVARGTEAEEVLKAVSPIAQNPMFDLTVMTQQQDQQVGDYTPVLLAWFLDALSMEGIDPIVPAVRVVQIDKQKVLRLDGMAVFHADKLVGYLNERESRGYRWLRRNPSITGGLITIESPVDKKPILLEVLRSSTSIKPEVKGGKIIFKIKIREDGNFYEQQEANEELTTAVIKSLEARTATMIENEARAYLQRSQALNCDCVGFGLEIYRQQPGLWDQIGPQWSEYYPRVQFEFDVTAKIRRTYLTCDGLKIK